MKISSDKILYLRKEALKYYTKKSDIPNIDKLYYYEGHLACDIYIDKVNYTEEFLKESKVLLEYNSGPNKWTPGKFNLILINEFLLNVKKDKNAVLSPNIKKELLDHYFIPIDNLEVNLIKISDLYDINKTVVAYTKDTNLIVPDEQSKLSNEVFATITNTNKNEQNKKVCAILHHNSKKCLAIDEIINKTNNTHNINIDAYITNWISIMIARTINIGMNPTYLNLNNQSNVFDYPKMFNQYIVSKIVGTIILDEKKQTVLLYDRNIVEKEIVNTISNS